MAHTPHFAESSTIQRQGMSVIEPSLQAVVANAIIALYSQSTATYGKWYVTEVSHNTAINGTVINLFCETGWKFGDGTVVKHVTVSVTGGEYPR
jgi:hypothetical protein